MAGGWLAEPSEASLRDALAAVAPDLATLPLRINPRYLHPNPMYWSGSAWIDERLVVKYAWSPIRAERLWREQAILTRLRGGPDPLRVPEVVARCETPTLFVTTAVTGVPLSVDLASGLDADGLATVAEHLAGFLVRLHGLPVDDVLHDLAAVVPTAQSTTDVLRARFPAIVDEARGRVVLGWCDWVDDVQADARRPAPVLVHGDLHGYNQVWDRATLELRALVDFEESGAEDRHFDFRYLPGNARSLDLVLAVVDAYERASGISLELDRLMAWHALSVLGDALWRTEAAVPLPGDGDAANWVDDLRRRLDQLDLP